MGCELMWVTASGSLKVVPVMIVNAATMVMQFEETLHQTIIVVLSIKGSSSQCIRF